MSQLVMNGTARRSRASSLEEWLWLTQRVSQKPSLYHIRFALTLQGELAPNALERALQRVVARHPSLRSTFEHSDGVLHRIVHERMSIPLVLEIVEPQPGVDRLEDALRLASAEAERLFDLVAGPLLRVKLYRLDPVRHLLVAVFNHLVFDGWSERIFLEELAQAYERELSGERIGEEASVASSAEAHAGRLSESDTRRLLDFWRTQLAGAPTIELPTDRPRRALPRHRGASHRVALSHDLLGRLERFSRAERVSLASVLLAAFFALLSRYSGQSDVSVGTPFAGRSSSAEQAAIGLFVNTIVARLVSSREETFRQSARRVHSVMLDAVEHAELPFDRLVDELQPARDPSRNPLFQVWFSLEHVATPPSFGPAHAQRAQMPLDTSMFDLTVKVERESGSASVLLWFDPDLFDDATIRRMATHLVVLLEAAVSNVDAPMRTLRVLTGPEREGILHTWNATRRPYPSDRTSAQLFEEQVGLHPDLVAVRDQREEWSYSRLNARANALAWTLRRLGVGPETTVGVLLERSIEMVVAVLAITKAGGAYLPLEPDYPEDRLSFMVGDTSASVVLTDTDSDVLARRVAPRSTVLRLDGDEAYDENDSNPAPAGDSQSLAYVIYTSGSTGNPNGVGVSHQALARLTKNGGYCRLGPGEVHLFHAPLAFDASLIELWGALHNGGTVAVAPRGMTFLEQIKQAVPGYGVTTLLLISPQFHLVAEHALDALAGVRQLLVGGDVLSPAHTARALPHLEHLDFIHVYGPTECTLFATATKIEAIEPDRPSVPIGRPIGNTQAYVLGEDLEPVPVGVAGQLYLAGDGLARGYVNRPALTAARFVPHPFVGSGQRLYATGDRARYLPDGNIEFLGRIDHQVKVRGFRIELGEVEQAIAAIPEVEDVAVKLAQDERGAGNLAAFVVTRDRRTLALERLRAELQESLPAHMIPATVSTLDELPLTGNGKVDRDRLAPPAPEPGDRESAAEDALRGDTEKKVAQLWAEVLEVESVGRDEKFFESGGNSLRLATLFELLTEAFPDADFAIVDLFEYTSCAEIAGMLDARRGRRSGDAEETVLHDL